MPTQSPLGQKTIYKNTYSPELLYPVPRSLARNKTGIPLPISFKGIDLWNGYELSWLNPKGKPEIAVGEFIFPISNPNIVESKSFKLYLNSFNQSHFNSIEEVRSIIERDLSKSVEGDVIVNLFHPNEKPLPTSQKFHGQCLDHLDVEITTYETFPEFLKTKPNHVEETLYTDLLKSNCLATGQPDWGSVQIHYKGPQINHEGLLKYFISFRNHAGFAEHCAEQMYHDISRMCHPEELSVYIRYTKRGGLDINPYRSSSDKTPDNNMLYRQ